MRLCSRVRSYVSGLRASSVVFIFCIVFTTICFVIYNTSFTFDRPKFVKTKKLIVYWNNFFNEKHFAVGLGSRVFEEVGCPVVCDVYDMMDGDPGIPHHMYDAVIFHTAEGFETVLDNIPNERAPHQRYVFALMESPVTRPLDLEPYRNFFNWTMTYRRDSDIYWPYGWFSPLNLPGISRPSQIPLNFQKPDLENLTVPIVMKAKTKLIAWCVSNCHTQSMRGHFVIQLQKYLPVDIYGACGPLKNCSRGVDCELKLARDYKFYLSFENSLCKDYVTEKFFRMAKYDIIPVVYGGAKYSEIAPPLSYIDVNDFNTVEELAQFLTYLSRNPLEYQKYFWWKSFYGVYSRHQHLLCQICEKLHNASDPLKVYHDVQWWWSDPETCTTPLEWT